MQSFILSLGLMAAIAAGPSFSLTPHLQTLLSHIETSLLEDDLERQLELCREIQDSNYQRQGLSSQEMRDLKHALAHWRGLVTESALSKALSSYREAELAISVLDVIKPRLSLEQVFRVGELAVRYGGLKPRLGLLLADYGSRDAVEPILVEWQDTAALRRLGPPVIEKIEPYSGTNLKGLDWVDGTARKMGPMEPEHLDAFEFRDRHTIYFRGHEIKTGDVFIFDLALAYDGLMSSFAEMPPAFNHAGVFVVFQRNGRQVPAILEMHEKGNRVIPLSNFMERHVFYAESYRLRTAHDAWRDLVRDEIEKLQLGERLFQDFRALPLESGDLPSRDGDIACTTCTTMTEMIFRRTGQDIRFERTPFGEGAKRNLTILGLGGVSDLTLPVSLGRHPDMELKGVFDNGRQVENLGRELLIGDVYAEGSVGHAMNTEVFDIDRLPSNRYTQAMAAMKANRRAFAPPEAIAFFLTTNESIGAQSEIVSAACRDLVASLGKKPFVFGAVQKKPQIKQTVLQGFKDTGIPNWYRVP